VTSADVVQLQLLHQHSLVICAHVRDAAAASFRLLPRPLKAVMLSHWYAPSWLLLLLCYLLLLALLLAWPAGALLGAYAEPGCCCNCSCTMLVARPAEAGCGQHAAGGINCCCITCCCSCCCAQPQLQELEACVVVKQHVVPTEQQQGLASIRIDDNLRSISYD
jgi:hypothetical protein